MGQLYVEQPVVQIGRGWASVIEQEVLLWLLAQDTIFDAELVVVQDDLLNGVNSKDNAVTVKEAGKGLGNLGHVNGYKLKFGLAKLGKDAANLGRGNVGLLIL